MDSLFPGQRSHWRLNPTWAPPGGEIRLEVSERAAAVVTDLMSTTAWDAGSVMLVAHGGTIGALTSRLLDVPVSHYPMFGGLGNTRWSQLVARPTEPDATGPELWASARWFLEGWNVGVAAPPPVGVSNADEGDGRVVGARLRSRLSQIPRHVCPRPWRRSTASPSSTSMRKVRATRRPRLVWAPWN